MVAFAGRPNGWRVVSGKADRAARVGYAEHNWADTRPKSLHETLAKNLSM